MENYLKMSNNQVLVYVILGAILFFVFILPMIDYYNNNYSNSIKESLSNTMEIRKLDKNICSKQCCKHTQWPVPHDLHKKDIPEEEMKNYVGTNFSCNFGSGSGCLCVSKDDFNYLANRGNNTGGVSCN